MYLHIQGPPCDEKAYYRSYDGTCNNVVNPTWGASLTPQLREIPPMYDDGKNSCSL
ncbi:hypothetical protein DPMN_061946 [Dreissena polymorpha]|uniref:Uncharacterized protein n=1 Tax=Dreissena polymorpha TaxID=45954 RepID=A0A9D4C8R7_DREPO|nr:hypothetical protein DPMN_061946 [Dreissena polymorpha]